MHVHLFWRFSCVSTFSNVHAPKSANPWSMWLLKLEGEMRFLKQREKGRELTVLWGTLTFQGDTVLSQGWGFEVWRIRWSFTENISFTVYKALSYKAGIGILCLRNSTRCLSFCSVSVFSTRHRTLAINFKQGISSRELGAYKTTGRVSLRVNTPL